MTSPDYLDNEIWVLSLETHPLLQSSAEGGTVSGTYVVETGETTVTEVG